MSNSIKLGSVSERFDGDEERSTGQLPPNFELPGVNHNVLQQFIQIIVNGTVLSVDSSSRVHTHLGFYVSFLSSEFESWGPLFEPLCPPRSKDEQKALDWFFAVLLAIWQHFRDACLFTLPSGAAYLQERQLIESDSSDLSAVVRQFHLEQRLIFFAIGCLTLLFRPKSDNPSVNVFRIDNMDSSGRFRFNTPLRNTIDATANRKPARDLLRDFGDLSPMPDPSEAEELKKASSLLAEEFNAHVMLSTCKLKIAWTDILGTHLDFDERTKILYLFKYPTLCLINMPTTQQTEFTTPLGRCLPEYEVPGDLSRLI